MSFKLPIEIISVLLPFAKLFSKKVWGLPFSTALAPSERYHQEQQHRHKKLTDWARQMIFQVRRWLPNRELVIVTDSSFACLELLSSIGKLASTSMITRLRLDAALYKPAPSRPPGTMGRPRLKGKSAPPRLGFPQA